jgi:hypothetical protein
MRGIPIKIVFVYIVYIQFIYSMLFTTPISKSVQRYYTESCQKAFFSAHLKSPQNNKRTKNQGWRGMVERSLQLVLKKCFVSIITGKSVKIILKSRQSYYRGAFNVTNGAVSLKGYCIFSKTDENSPYKFFIQFLYLFHSF